MRSSIPSRYRVIYTLCNDDGRNKRLSQHASCRIVSHKSSISGDAKVEEEITLPLFEKLEHAKYLVKYLSIVPPLMGLLKTYVVRDWLHENNPEQSNQRLYGKAELPIVWLWLVVHLCLRVDWVQAQSLLQYHRLLLDRNIL